MDFNHICTMRPNPISTMSRSKTISKSCIASGDRMMDVLGNEEWICNHCGALLWVNVAGDGQHYLMRIGEIEVSECAICEAITEAIS
jgi:hypothetical protein